MTATEFTLAGDLAAPGFADWICHRARLLNLDGYVSQEGDALTIVVAGPDALIGAMETACSLGPTYVDVTRIETRPTVLPDHLNGFARL